MRKQATQVDPQRAQRTTFVTAGGVHVTRTAEPFDPDILEGLTSSVDQRRGGVLSSGMEYPGRYSRWHLAYVDPCAEIVARGRHIAVRALNARGGVLLPVLGEALRRAGQPVPGAAAGDAREIEVVIPEPSGLVAEEDRSRRPTVFTALREVIAAFAGDDPHLGLYGAFGYDLAFQFEPVRFRRDRPAEQRDLVLHLPDQVYALDRKRESAMVYRYEFSAGGISTEGLPRQTAPSPVRVTSPAPGFVAEKNFRAKPQPGAFAQVVGQAKERFARGDLFEVVPSHVFRGECDSPAAFYETLRQVNPAPYEFFFNLGEGESLVGASPEMYVRVSGDRVETCPISGTIRRGADPLGDAENIRTLLNSAKEESELTMCTDVDRNDKSRVCVPGSVTVIGRRQIEMYSRLIHTVDHIEGRLRPGLDALDAFLSHMWAVTVTGAPKTWAMQFIEDHEDAPRCWYGGAVGVIGFDGNMNTGLTLRTAHIRDGVAAVRAGATLLFECDPEAEERETELKSRALLETLALAQAAVRAGETAAEPAPRRPSRLSTPWPGPARACGSCWWITRTRSCTRWPVTSGRKALRWSRCGLVSPRPCSMITGPTWWCCRPARGSPAISAATPCSASSMRGGCPRSVSASGCRPWWSTPGESWACSPSPRTASRARSGGPGRVARDCYPGFRTSSPRVATTPCTRSPGRSRAASRSPPSPWTGWSWPSRMNRRAGGACSSTPSRSCRPRAAPAIRSSATCSGSARPAAGRSRLRRPVVRRPAARRLVFPASPPPARLAGRPSG